MSIGYTRRIFNHHLQLLIVLAVISIVLFCLSRGQHRRSAFAINNFVYEKECKKFDEKYPYFFITLDESWTDKTDSLLVLHNNSDCVITIVTAAPPMRHKQITKARNSTNDVDQIIIKYKINSDQQLWAFITYWPHGDSVYSYSLKGGKSVKFLVPSKFLGKKRQIAIPFNYEYEDAKGRSGIEHLIYSPPDLLMDSSKK